MIDPSLLENFYAHRKDDLKKPMSDRAKSMLINKLERAEREGHDIELLLENAIIGGWQTVYPNEQTKVNTGFIARHTNQDWRKDLQ